MNGKEPYWWLVILSQEVITQINVDQVLWQRMD